jgi:ribosome biogenesis GTPase
MLRERLKKEDIAVLVGDYVEIEELNEETKQAVITQLHERESYISRPHIANMEQNIIIMSLNKPPLSFMQLDRFITHTCIAGLEMVICINKCDFKDKKNILPALKEIYNPLNIQTIELSAKTLMGFESFIEVIKNKKNIFSGPSGVGKSTILNILKPGINLRTGNIGSKSNKGTHTTRHTELIFLDFKDNSTGIIADTPGFSYLKFDRYLPETIEASFPEFLDYKDGCYYSDCLHINEVDCNVKANLDKISQTRYESYCRFISEALEYKAKLFETSTKEEGKIKTIDSSGQQQIRRLKLGHDLVDPSRKTYKQKLSSYKFTDDLEENNEELD